MNKDEKECRALLGRNIKRFRNRLGLSQLNLSLELGISATFLSDLETGKKWVSEQTLSKIARVLKVEIYELFRPEQTAKDVITVTISEYLDSVDDAFIKTIEDAIRPAVKRTLKKIRRANPGGETNA